MKLNISHPAAGTDKSVDIEDERKLRIFYDHPIGSEVAVDALGDEFRGYIMRIMGGYDKQGFPMRKGTMVPHRVRLLLKQGSTCFRARRDGQRRRKSVRGCIVGPDLSALSLCIVRVGDNPLPGLTDTTRPMGLPPKRASKIRRLFNLSKDDDVTKYAIVRKIRPKEGGRPHYRTTKIQRLVTPEKRRQRIVDRKKRLLRVRRSIALGELYRQAVQAKQASVSQSKAVKQLLKRDPRACVTRQLVLCRGRSDLIKTPLGLEGITKVKPHARRLMTPAQFKEYRAAKAKSVNAKAKGTVRKEDKGKTGEAEGAKRSKGKTEKASGVKRGKGKTEQTGKAVLRKAQSSGGSGRRAK